MCDGISVGQLALKNLNIPVQTYFSSEIDKNCIKTTQHNFPNTIQVGDVKNVNGHELGKVDLVLCGSSCQNLSIMNGSSRFGLEGEKSSIFYECVRVLNEVKKNNPNYLFIFENVQMPARDLKIFQELLRARPINLNSSLLGPVNRNRLYFTNIERITIPRDNGAVLSDIITDGFVDRKKANAVLTKNVPYTRNGLIRYLKKSLGQVAFHDKAFAELPKKEKLKAIESMADEQVKSLFRLFTLQEIEQLQGLPIGYVSSVIKPTPCLRSSGNAFDSRVFEYLLSFADFG